MRILLAALQLLPGLLLVSVLGCDPVAGPVPQPDPDPILEPVTPVAMTGAAGGPLKTAPAVRATDGEGRPLAGIPVIWATAHGQLQDDTVITSSEGVAVTLWAPPSSPGTYSAAASVEGGASVEFEATTVADISPPALVALTFAADTVFVGPDSAILQVEITSSDGGSGVYWTILDLRGPGEIQSARCSDLAAWNDTTTERSVTCALIIPAYSESGSWRVHHLVLQDRIANETQYTADDLEALQIDAAVEVVSADPDTLAPVIASLSFEPDTVDVTESAAIVTFTARLLDDLAGVTAAQLAVDEIGGSWTECLEMARAEGDALDGLWSCPVTIPAGARPGEWTLRRVTAWDRAGNWHSFMAEDLEAAGHPTRLVVVNDSADLEPPRLLSVDLAPDTADISAGPVTVQISLGVADSGSGVAETTVFLRAPGASSASGCRATVPVEGTVSQGIFRCSIEVPGAGVEGDWKLDDLSIDDAAGNSAYFTTADLEAAGLPVTVTVIR